MRQRIACFVLILTLTLPAAGWTRVAAVDPDGQNIEVLVESAPGPVPGPSLFHLFITWFQTHLLCV